MKLFESFRSQHTICSTGAFCTPFATHDTSIVSLYETWIPLPYRSGKLGYVKLYKGRPVPIEEDADAVVV